MSLTTSRTFNNNTEETQCGDEVIIRKRKRTVNTTAPRSKRRATKQVNPVVTTQTLTISERELGAIGTIQTTTRKTSDMNRILGNSGLSPSNSSKYTFINYFMSAEGTNSPLPDLGWGDSQEVWNIMLKKDRECSRDCLYVRRHEGMIPKLRAILLEWLIEVCESYSLHRESFHLALDYIDRYLSVKPNIPRSRLQLVGVTALFIATKIEEIYPPKLHQIAYITDGACTEDEIIKEELIIMKALEWRLSPITINTWLNTYLQIINHQSPTYTKPETSKKQNNFSLPRYSQTDFVLVSQLVELCVLDVDSLKFSYSILAAAALYHMLPVDISSITGHKWEELFPCIQWMRPFATTVREKGAPRISCKSSVPAEDLHNIQTHCVNLSMLEEACSRQMDFLPEPSHQRSPPLVAGMLTPPSSAKKQRK